MTVRERKRDREDEMLEVADVDMLKTLCYFLLVTIATVSVLKGQQRSELSELHEELLQTED